MFPNTPVTVCGTISCPSLATTLPGSLQQLWQNCTPHQGPYFHRIQSRSIENWQCLSSQASTPLFKSYPFNHNTHLSIPTQAAMMCMNRFVLRVCDLFPAQSFFWIDKCWIIRKAQNKANPSFSIWIYHLFTQSSFWMYTRLPSMSLLVLGYELHLNPLGGISKDSCSTVYPKLPVGHCLSLLKSCLLFFTPLKNDTLSGQLLNRHGYGCYIWHELQCMLNSESN